MSTFDCGFLSFFPHHTCLESQEKENWPLGFTKIESPTTIIGWVSQDKNMASGLYENGKPSSHNRLGVTGQNKSPLGFTKIESPAAAKIVWVSQDKTKDLWALRKWKAQQHP
jgi:hypothetical protein